MHLHYEMQMQSAHTIERETLNAVAGIPVEIFSESVCISCHGPLLFCYDFAAV